ncbi:hypothetical protein LTS18_001412, partial [Coniosporium uncinatum]
MSWVGTETLFLTTALQNLANLQDVELRDYHADGRYRDGTSWKSYGFMTMKQETGRMPQFFQQQPQTSTEVSRYFTIIAAAIKEAQRPLKTLATTLRKDGLVSAAFYIPEVQTLSFRDTFKSLEVLMLALATSYGYSEPLSTDKGDTFPIDPLDKFFTLVPNLIKLRLNFSFSHTTSQLLGSLNLSNTLCHLRQLELGKAKPSWANLEKFTTQWPQSLTHLTLMWITLSEGSWTSLLDSIKNKLSLTFIKLESLRELRESHTPFIIGFQPVGTKFTSLEEVQQHSKLEHSGD